ncbi:uncharacterized protein LOC116351096 [Contarinia nasturtii]|uniref:uncharacterized protein LOC116351096 n=1 Tax=Contarinia nasturtii TaxID=265458 RepID=UPI0012D4377B|nr:uncharacterized protein LOC116351096 [Contarinia nasturtii]
MVYRKLITLALVGLIICEFLMANVESHELDKKKKKPCLPLMLTCLGQNSQEKVLSPDASAPISISAPNASISPIGPHPPEPSVEEPLIAPRPEYPILFPGVYGNPIPTPKSRASSSHPVSVKRSNSDPLP